MSMKKKVLGQIERDEASKWLGPTICVVQLFFYSMWTFGQRHLSCICRLHTGTGSEMTQPRQRAQSGVAIGGVRAEVEAGVLVDPPH